MQLLLHYRINNGPWLPAHSFVRNFLLLLERHLGQRATVTIQQSGIPASGGPIVGSFGVNTGLGTYTGGLQVGTGTNSPNKADYILQTLITHGVGAGQLQYGTTTIGVTLDQDGSVAIEITRLFTNLSGGAITVNEMGLAMNSQTGGYILCARDLPTPIVIPNGGNANLYYQLTITP